MSRKSSKNTKGKIISSAWKLFYEQGFDDTTVEDIVYESGTSKGSFYHYFSGKDALMGTLANIFDEKYEQLMVELDPEMNAIEKLIYLNRELFLMIDKTVSVELLSRLFSTQLLQKGEKSLLDRDRYYFRLLRNIITEGQRRGELLLDLSCDVILNDYAMMERALMYDWCLNRGRYELAEYSSRIMPAFLQKYRDLSYRET